MVRVSGVENHPEFDQWTPSLVRLSDHYNTFTLQLFKTYIYQGWQFTPKEGLYLARKGFLASYQKYVSGISGT